MILKIIFENYFYVVYKYEINFKSYEFSYWFYTENVRVFARTDGK